MLAHAPQENRTTEKVLSRIPWVIWWVLWCQRSVSECKKIPPTLHIYLYLSTQEWGWIM